MRWVVFLLLVLAIVPFAIAEDQVVINSKDWHDVYSGSLYASLLGLEYTYAINEEQALDLIN